MKLRLPDNIFSPQDLKAVILEVHEYSRWFSHASVKKRAGAGNIGQPAAVSAAAAQLIKDWFGDKPFTQQGLDGLNEALEEFDNSSPQVTIVLAAAPSNGLKKDLVAWCRQNVEPNVLVNFEFNSTLLGGMVVRWRSRIFDWSFRRQVLAERYKFPEVLRRV